MRPKRGRNPSKSKASDLESTGNHEAGFFQHVSSLELQGQKEPLSSSHGDITQHKGTTQQGISSTPTTKTVPVDAKSNPKQNDELREQIAKSFIDDPAILKAIVDPIATLLAGKIIDSGLMMGKLADSLVVSKLFVDSIALAVQETIAQKVYDPLWCPPTATPRHREVHEL